MLQIKKNCYALLIIDMREYFQTLAEPILPNLRQLIQYFRQADISIIFTRHAHKNSDEDGGMLAKWWGDLIIDGTPQAEIIPEIKPLVTEKVIHKKRYSAFFQTDLHRHLHKNRIQQLFIGRVMTNLCCETTARDAFVYDYEVFFLMDGTATNSEDFQRATFLNLSFGFAYLVGCKEICNAIFPY